MSPSALLPMFRLLLRLLIIVRTTAILFIGFHSCAFSASAFLLVGNSIFSARNYYYCLSLSAPDNDITVQRRGRRIPSLDFSSHSYANVYSIPDDDDDDDNDMDRNKAVLNNPFGMKNTSNNNSNSNASITFANVSYFYLQQELGLSEEALWKYTSNDYSVLGMSTAVIRGKVDLLRDSLNLSDENIRTILERQPSVLHLSAEKNIRPKLEFLRGALELTKDDLRALVIGCPSILGYRKENIAEKISFFTEILEFTVAECRSLFLKDPRLIRSSVDSALLPRMRFLCRDMEMSIGTLKKIVQKNPPILYFSIENLAPKLVYFLLTKLDMTTAQMHKVLLNHPAFVNSSLDRKMLPVAHYFVDELGFSWTEFRSILLKFPRLTAYSLSNIKHYVGYFRYEVGMTPDQVKRVLFRAPSVISCNTDNNVHKKVQFLKTQLDLDDNELRKVIATMPDLLKLNSEKNLLPKIEYLRRNLESSESTLREIIVLQPIILGCSLEKRIQPRLEAILDASLDPRKITYTIAMKQDKFEAWLERRNSEIAAQSISALPAAPADDTKEEREQLADGRIAHWTRERRPLR